MALCRLALPPCAHNHRQSAGEGSLVVKEHVPAQVILAGEALGAVAARVRSLARVALQVLVQVVLAREAHGAVATSERPLRRRVLPQVALQVVLAGEADGAVATLEGEARGAPGGRVGVVVQPRKNRVQVGRSHFFSDHTDVQLMEDWREVLTKAACQGIMRWR